MTKFKWHLLLTPEVSTEQSQGIISVKPVAFFKSPHWPLGSVFPVCVLDKVWSHTKMSSGSHWFLPICKHSSHFEKIQMAFNFLAVQRTSFRPCRCSEQSQWPRPQTAVTDKAALCLPAEAALHSSSYKGSLGSYQLWLQPELLVEDRNPTRALWDCPVLCLGYPEMPLLVQCCCPSTASALVLSLFSSPAFCGWKFEFTMTIYPYFSHALLLKDFTSGGGHIARHVGSVWTWLPVWDEFMTIWKLAVAILTF